MNALVMVLLTTGLWTNPTLAAEGPEDVARRAMSAMMAGGSEEARSLFLVTNERQRMHVQKNIKQCHREVSMVGGVIEVLRSFVKDDCAVVMFAVSSTRADPAMYNVGYCCMIRGPQGWQLLPDYPTYTGEINEVSDAQKDAFKEMWPSAVDFRNGKLTEWRRTQH